MLVNRARVGVIMLLHNRADVGVVCLQSLAQTHVDAPWELYLLDNASQASESQKVASEFAKLVQKGRLRGQFIRSEINHGFPRGNNLGIRFFLERDDISHICLLNSDVVVTDHWLDRLLDKNADAIGPVTNACGNEQTIPVPHDLQPNQDVYGTVNEWAQARHRSFNGYCKATDFLGFFCFLARVEVFLTVGLLDEQYGTGAYEDDDFCLRILAKGYHMLVARDVFVYHWGSASFSQITPRNLNRHLKQNRKKFESRYECQWKDRSLQPLAGVWDDMQHIAAKVSDADLQLAEWYRERSVAYVQELLQEQGRAKLCGRLRAFFQRVVDRWAHRWRRVSSGRVSDFLRALFMKRPVVVLGRYYPAGADLKDGYFQRVRLIDELLDEHCRLYFRYEGLDSLTKWLPKVKRKNSRVYEIAIRHTNILHLVAAAALLLLSRRIYIHSVLRLSHPFSRLLYRMARVRVFDVHGVVPEEFRYHGDGQNTEKFDKLERLAIDRASLVVVVTRAMAEHLSTKYGENGVRRYACLPMLPQTGRWGPYHLNADENNTVIYSGGLHKWQQVDKMLEYVRRQAGRLRFTFLVTQPDELKRLYRERYGVELQGTVLSVLPEEVSGWYKNHAYGLVLRERSIVNRVACPTKLVEYLQHGIVPIVDSPDIGDFRGYGYRYVEFEESLPNETVRVEMAQANQHVLRKIYCQFLFSLEKLRSVL